jgi:hypothetical protein
VVAAGSLELSSQHGTNGETGRRSETSDWSKDEVGENGHCARLVFRQRVERFPRWKTEQRMFRLRVHHWVCVVRRNERRVAEKREDAVGRMRDMQVRIRCGCRRGREVMY